MALFTLWKRVMSRGYGTNAPTEYSVQSQRQTIDLENNFVEEILPLRSNRNLSGEKGTQLPLKWVELLKHLNFSFGASWCMATAFPSESCWILSPKRCICEVLTQLWIIECNCSFCILYVKPCMLILIQSIHFGGAFRVITVSP